MRSKSSKLLYIALNKETRPEIFGWESFPELIAKVSKISHGHHSIDPFIVFVALETSQVDAALKISKKASGDSVGDRSSDFTCFLNVEYIFS